MTKKEFREALLRGQGRAFQALEAEPEKFRAVLLRACAHESAFDPQCEGTRAQYIYRMLSCFEDKTPFLSAVLESFERVKSDGSWKLTYLAELLAQFAQDGEAAARDALWRKYDRLYERLLAKKRLPKGLFPEKDDFTNLCVVLAGSRDSFLQIAEDIGRLLTENKLYDGGDFAWFGYCCGKRYFGTLKKHAKSSENAAAYLRAVEEYDNQSENAVNMPARSLEELTGAALSLTLKRSQNPQLLQKYADKYLAQSDDIARAGSLKAFCRCPYPGDPTPVIADARSDCANLKDAAWEALENIRDLRVREFAIAELDAGEDAALTLLIKNYENRDEKRLEALVRAIKVDRRDETLWHGTYIKVLKMTDDGLKAPAGLLMHIYETSYCSYCRGNALRQMGRRRLLTDEMLNECLYDSSLDIRAYARKVLKRRTGV